MCGPTGSSFCLGMSIFGMAFLSVLAGLITEGYPYVGEWFEAKAEPGHTVEPLEEQRERAVHNLWVATGIYGGFAVLSGVFVCIHKLRGRL